MKYFVYVNKPRELFIQYCPFSSATDFDTVVLIYLLDHSFFSVYIGKVNDMKINSLMFEKNWDPRLTNPT